MAKNADTHRNKTIEPLRLDEARENRVPWKLWGPYLSERQWGTVREDYSEKAMRGIISPTTRPARAPTTGVRTALPGSVTSTSGYVLPLPCGTVRTRS